MIDSCLIVGAGLTGLIAAQTLVKNGVSVHIIDAGARVGGRMATAQIECNGHQALFDHGAQFFTARSPEFKAAVAEWQAAGLISEWFHGQTKVRADGTIQHERDGHPRFRATGGMQAIPQFLARTVNVHQGQSITKITRGKQWEVGTDRGEAFSGDALILTPPVPQSLALLDTGTFCLEPQTRAALEEIEYDPCLAVLLLLREASELPAEGALYFESEPISWIADNARKGVSPTPGAVTIHAAPRFSHEYWDAEPQVVVKNLQAVAETWLGSSIEKFEVCRWRYAKPSRPRHEGFLAVPGANLVFAGDAFAGAKVEGAYRSGLLAARHLLEGPNR